MNKQTKKKRKEITFIHLDKWMKGTATGNWWMRKAKPYLRQGVAYSSALESMISKESKGRRECWGCKGQGCSQWLYKVFLTPLYVHWNKSAQLEVVRFHSLLVATWQTHKSLHKSTAFNHIFPARQSIPNEMASQKTGTVESNELVNTALCSDHVKEKNRNELKWKEKKRYSQKCWWVYVLCAEAVHLLITINSHQLDRNQYNNYNNHNNCKDSHWTPGQTASRCLVWGSRNCSNGNDFRITARLRIESHTGIEISIEADIRIRI